MELMLEAGLDSMPGGGAEIFHPEIRDQIAGGKCSGEEWLRIHEIWHGLGKNQTQLCFTVISNLIFTGLTI
jgi:aminodeoxyfutalosine synthase